MAGACGLATTSAVAMRELQVRRSYAISNGATQTTARQHFAAHSRASVSSMLSNVEVTGARLQVGDQGAMLHARPGTPPCYTAANHLRLPLVGSGNETTYSTLTFTKLRNAFISFKTAFGRTT